MLDAKPELIQCFTRAIDCDAKHVRARTELVRVLLKPARRSESVAPSMRSRAIVNIACRRGSDVHPSLATAR